jgi:GNAT superfamily N-acetyltransferase
MPDDLVFEPLTASTWPQLEQLFGARGACAGCWCMYWRRSPREYEQSKGAANRAALKGLARKGSPLGLIALRAGQPVGWCAVAPRSDFVRLGRRGTLEGNDVWSIVCLFIKRAERRRGVSSALIRAACAFAIARGAAIVESYPVEPKQETLPDVFAWTGLRAAFERAGFQEVGRTAPTRPIMRWSPTL